jgi:hypothetical protein
MSSESLSTSRTFKINNATEVVVQYEIFFQLFKKEKNTLGKAALFEL